MTPWMLTAKQAEFRNADLYRRCVTSDSVAVRSSSMQHVTESPEPAAYATEAFNSRKL